MKEYLSTLNTRNKWVEEKRNIASDDVVLMVDPGNPRGHWVWVEFKRFFLALTGRLELYASQKAAKIMYDQSQSCVRWRYKEDGRNRTHSCSRGRMFRRTFAY